MALQTNQVTVGTASVLVLDSQPNPTLITMHNAEKSSNEFIWYGGSLDVTTSTGIHIDNAETRTFTLNTGNKIYAITDKPGKTLHISWQVV